jgi:predicted XRE-type DNA-binding protein
MKAERFASVWDAIEDRPEATANMKLRSALMIAIAHKVQATSVTQADLAQRLRLTQPRVSDLLRGKISLFSLDALVGIADRLGIQVLVDPGTTAPSPG